MTRLLRYAAPLLAALTLLGGAGPALSQQGWPNKPIRWVVPYPPGGASDVLARQVAQRLSERLGQPVVIDNRAGAGGNVGTEFVAKSPPDGYTIVLGNIGPISVNKSLYGNLTFDPEKDLAPISLLAAYPNVVVVNPAHPARSIRDVVEAAKSPQGMSYASPGVGTSLHLAGELLASTAGVKLRHVPYKGSAPGLNDTAAGHVPMAIDPVSNTSLGLVRAGKLRALAVTSTERSPLLPDVPTIAESGLPGFDVTGWIGVLAPAGTPQPILQRLAQEITSIMQSPEMKKSMAESGAIVPPLGPQHFAQFIRTESAKWQKVVQSANIKAE